MANGDEVQFKAGSSTLPKLPTPSAIAARGIAQDSLARTVLGGIVLVILAAGYVGALWCKIDGAEGVLGVLGTGLGFMLGQARRSDP